MAEVVNPQRNAADLRIAELYDADDFDRIVDRNLEPTIGEEPGFLVRFAIESPSGPTATRPLFFSLEVAQELIRCFNEMGAAVGIIEDSTHG